jgi:hypothetical protein
VATARPHRFFWATLAAIAAGALAAVAAGSASPTITFDSNIVYRALVGLVVGGIVYIAVVALWNAWHGRALPIGLPGGGSVDPKGTPLDAVPPQLESVADDIDAYEKKTDRRFEQLEEAIAELDERTAPSAEPKDDDSGESHDVT